jgi:hypothetical protein
LLQEPKLTLSVERSKTPLWSKGFLFSSGRGPDSALRFVPVVMQSIFCVRTAAIRRQIPRQSEHLDRLRADKPAVLDRIPPTPGTLAASGSRCHSQSTESQGKPRCVQWRANRGRFAPALPKKATFAIKVGNNDNR